MKAPLFTFLILYTCLLFSFVSSADVLEESYTGTEFDVSGNVAGSFVIDIDDFVQGADGNYIVNQSFDLFSEVPSFEGGNELRSITNNSLSFVFRNVPASSTINGQLTLHAYYQPTSPYSVSSGYVYSVSASTPASLPRANISSTYVTGSLDLSTRYTCTLNGYTIFDTALNSTQIASLPPAYVPMLSSSAYPSFVQDHVLNYSITNTKSTANNITVTLYPSSPSGLTFTKQASLASLYSFSGKDYSAVLAEISTAVRQTAARVGASNSYLSALQGYIVTGFGLGDGEKSIRSHMVTLQTQNEALYNLIVNDFRYDMAGTGSRQTMGFMITQLYNTIGRNSSSGFRGQMSNEFVDTRYSLQLLRAHMDEALGYYGTGTSLKASLDNLTSGYDSSAGSSVNQTLNDKLDEYDKLQDETFKDTSETLSNFSFSNAFNFAVGLQSSLQFVSSLIVTFTGGSGDFSVYISTLYVLVFLSIVLGIWRFSGK